MRRLLVRFCFLCRIFWKVLVVIIGCSMADYSTDESVTRWHSCWRELPWKHVVGRDKCLTEVQIWKAGERGGDWNNGWTGTEWGENPPLMVTITRAEEYISYQTNVSFIIIFIFTWFSMDWNQFSPVSTFAGNNDIIIITMDDVIFERLRITAEEDKMKARISRWEEFQERKYSHKAR